MHVQSIHEQADMRLDRQLGIRSLVIAVEMDGWIDR